MEFRICGTVLNRVVFFLKLNKNLCVFVSLWLIKGNKGQGINKED